MKRKVLSLLAVFILVCFVLGGCAAPTAGDSVSTSPHENNTDMAMDEKRTTITQESGNATKPPTEQEHKLIITYQIDYQIDDITEGNKFLKELLENYQGYADSEEVYSTRQTYTYTLRIPQENAEKFVDGLNEKFGNPSYLNKQTDNVGGTYADLETRIKTEDSKLERLNALMQKATDMKDMITLEEAIAESISRKESMQNEINYLDNSVRYSTVHLTLNAKSTISTPLKDNFATRIVKAFKNMFVNTTLFIQDVIILFISLLPFLIVMALIVVMIRKRRKKDPLQPKGDFFKWAKFKKNENNNNDLKNKDPKEVPPLDPASQIDDDHQKES